MSFVCGLQTMLHPSVSRTVQLSNRLVLNASQIFSAHKFTFNKYLKICMSFEYCRHLIE
jgi:hypothetical protein